MFKPAAKPKPKLLPPTTAAITVIIATFKTFFITINSY
jgi:hypothetical protein